MRKNTFNKNCEYCSNIFITWPGKPQRFCSKECGYKNRTLSTEQLFYKNLIKNENGCLEYKSRYSNGYGRVNLGNNKFQLAHRFAWELKNGSIPTDQCCLHKCDNPPCCEISHLFLGSHKDNTLDMVKKGRQNIKRGSKTSNHKLTEQDVKNIRLLLQNKTQPKKIAKLFNVNPETIRGINRGEHWAHIPGKKVIIPKDMPKGSNQYFAKLTEEKVKDILIKLKAGVPGNQLAKQYGVQRSTIYGIRDKKAWRHVTIDP